MTPFEISYLGLLILFGVVVGPYLSAKIAEKGGWNYHQWCFIVMFGNIFAVFYMLIFLKINLINRLKLLGVFLVYLVLGWSSLTFNWE